MPSNQEKLDLLSLLKTIPHIPEDFLKKFEEKLETMSEAEFNSAKKSIMDTAKKVIEHQKTYMETLENIQRNEINPIFKNLEKESQKKEEQNIQNTLSQL